MDAAAARAEEQQTRAELRSLVMFELNGDLYGVPVTDVAEICHPLACSPLPHVSPHVRGLINLRGVVLPLIDLRRTFDLPLKPHGPDNRLIILKGSGYEVAMWVDAVQGVARLPQSSFQPVPSDVACIDAEYYQHVAMLDERRLIELNVQRMLAGTAANPGENAGT